MTSPPLAIYIHIPFCPSKCGYCDFNSYAMEGEIVPRTAAAIEAEIRRSPLAGRPAKTIFFGGGTPTFLEPAALASILQAVTDTHPPEPGCEITSEANPGTVDAEKFRSMRQAGFNRISLGAQSFLDDDLIRLGRVHRSGEIERAVEAARAAGFDNLNLDLMFALEGQSRRGWQTNLSRALGLDPEHLSLYCLTIEPNTAFYRKQLHGQLHLPDEDEQAAMYEDCVMRMSEAGYVQYEISNFSKSGRECRHNLEYWHGAEYAGYGPGAVAAYETRVSRIRTTNLKHPLRYCEAIESGSVSFFESEELDESILRTERIMLGLRLNKGLSIEGLDLPLDRLEKLETRGWIKQSETQLTLTAMGRHFCSEVALELV